MPPVQSGDRPPHLIAPDEVADWLADSVNGRVTYHNTTPDAGAEIRCFGVRMDRSRRGSFGQGFYTATSPEPFHGPVSLQVAVRLRSPFLGHLDQAEDYIDDLIARISPSSTALTPALARRLRRELLEAGYDGLVIGDAGGDGVDYVVALVEDAVRIVTEE